MAKKKKRNSIDLKDASLVEIAKVFAKEVSLLKATDAKWDGEYISTELESLDEAIGIGGIPRGRIIEIFGDPSSGKTTLALHLVACVQRAGGKAAYIDAEHEVDLAYARKTVKLDTEKLLFSQPDSAEQALSLADRLLAARAVDILVIDSVAALTPEAEQEKGVAKPTMGLQAALMSRALRIIKPKVRKSNTIVVFINQTRSRIGVMYGNPTTTSGGQALKFYAAIRMNIRVKEPIKSKGKILGALTKIRMVKNKCGIPFKTATLKLLFRKGWRSVKDD